MIVTTTVPLLYYRPQEASCNRSGPSAKPGQALSSAFVQALLIFPLIFLLLMMEVAAKNWNISRAKHFQVQNYN